MGYVSFAMPARELFEQGLLGDFLPYVLSTLKRDRRDNRRDKGTDHELLLYGVGRKLGYRGISYSNLSWFIEAEHESDFKGGRPYELVDPEIRFEECYCNVCKGRMPMEIFEDGSEDEAFLVKELAAHNLWDLAGSLAGR